LALTAYSNTFFHVTRRPAVVLTDNYSDEHEQLLRPSGLEWKNAGVKQTTQCWAVCSSFVSPP